MLRRVLLGAAALAAAMLVVGPVFATTQYVIIKNSQYSPKTVTVQVGDTVSWQDADSGVQHSVTSAPDQAEHFDSSPACPPTCLERNDMYKHTFTHAGTFRYFCRVHCPDNSCAADGMRGTIVVAAAKTPAPTRTPAPTPVPRAKNTVSVTTPSAEPTPTPTASDVAALPATEVPSASPIAVPKTATSSGMGLALGLAITGAAIAALGGSLLFVRFRRPAS
jgi:plastocyanin